MFCNRLSVILRRSCYRYYSFALIYEHGIAPVKMILFEVYRLSIGYSTVECAQLQLVRGLLVYHLLYDLQIFSGYDGVLLQIETAPGLKHGKLISYNRGYFTHFRIY